MAVRDEKYIIQKRRMFWELANLVGPKCGFMELTSLSSFRVFFNANEYLKLAYESIVRNLKIV